MKKLVRDKIPEIIKSNGDNCEYYIAENNEYLEELKIKLKEETNEVIEAKTKEEKTEELADLIEVIHSFSKANNIKLEDIEKSRIAKKEKRGGFKEKIILTKY